jgi:hypothetical protein
MALLKGYRHAGQRSREKSTRELFGNPAVDIAGTEAPHRSELEPTNDSLPGIPLERFGMYPHDRRCLISIQQWFRHERRAGDWPALKLVSRMKLLRCLDLI